MSTRSTISVEHVDGSIESVYCHFDGYLAGVGNTLLSSYNSYDKVKELVSYGDISVLRSDIHRSIFYSRDHSESFRSDLFNSIDEYYRELSSQEFNYILRRVDRVWLYSQDDIFSSMRISDKSFRKFHTVVGPYRTENEKKKKKSDKYVEDIE
jgi:hypothetical protein